MDLDRNDDSLGIYINIRASVSRPRLTPSSATTLTMSDLLKLNCWILGDEPECIFLVKIAKIETVYTLKRAVIDENPDLRDIPARYLDIHSVSIPIDGDIVAKLAAFQPQDDSSNHNSSPVDVLSQVFPTEPSALHLHIIVQPPPVGKLE